MYKMTQWLDHVTQFTNKFREFDNPDGTITHEPVDGEVIQEGTPQNADNFNNMERGIFGNNQQAAELTRMVMLMRRVLEAGFSGQFSLDGDTLYNFINFGYFEGTPPHPPQIASAVIRGNTLDISPGTFNSPQEIPHGDTFVFFPGFASFGEDEALILNNL